VAESPDGTGEDIAGDGTRGWDVSDGDVASGGVTAGGGTSGGIITGGVTDDDETGGALKLEGGTRGDLTTVKGDTIPEGCDATTDGDTTSGSGCTAGSTDEELGGGEAGVEMGVSVAAKADIIVGGGLQCLVGGLKGSVLVFAIVVVVVHIATAVCPTTSLVSAGATMIPTSGTARFALVVGSDLGSSFTLLGSAPLVHIKMSLNMRAISWSIALRSDTKR